MKARFAIVALFLALHPFGTQTLAQSGANVVRISINPLVYSYLPIFIAVDKGYFKEQGLVVQTSTYRGSSVTQVPLLARGDLDIAPMVMGPGMFNQHSEGFGLKIVASIAGSNPSWSDTSWIMVRSDVWAAKRLSEIGDLKGLSIDGGPLGSPVNLLIREALRKAGLKLTDVQYSEKFRSPPDWIAAFKNKAIDVLAAVEPIVTMLEAQGLAKRWKSYKDAVPWFQETYFAASPGFLKSKRDAARRFLAAYLKAAVEVNATTGKWTPEMLETVTKWSKLPAKVIGKIPGPAFVGYLGAIDVSAIERQQEIWIGHGAVKQRVNVADLVDSTIMADVRRAAGIK